MLNHTGALWHYLGSFVLYTLFAIGLIYGAYLMMRKNTGGLLNFGATKPATPKVVLEMEATLELDPRKSLHVIRAGHERFLIATTMESTQLLSKLSPEEEVMPAPQPLAALLPEPVPVGAEERVELPWFADRFTDTGSEVTSASKPNSGFGMRFLQSVQWLIASRTNPNNKP